jgi:hypothetical protein
MRNYRGLQMKFEQALYWAKCGDFITNNRFRHQKILHYYKGQLYDQYGNIMSIKMIKNLTSSELNFSMGWYIYDTYENINQDIMTYYHKLLTTMSIEEFKESGFNFKNAIIINKEKEPARPIFLQIEALYRHSYIMGFINMIYRLISGKDLPYYDKYSGKYISPGSVRMVAKLCKNCKNSILVLIDTHDTIFETIDKSPNLLSLHSCKNVYECVLYYFYKYDLRPDEIHEPMCKPAVVEYVPDDLCSWIHRNTHNYKIESFVYLEGIPSPILMEKGKKYNFRVFRHPLYRFNLSRILKILNKKINREELDFYVNNCCSTRVNRTDIISKSNLKIK